MHPECYSAMREESDECSYDYEFTPGENQRGKNQLEE
jgi:hypothetical protein